jgi:hypothetical protein
MKQTAVEWLYHELDNILPEMYPSEWDKFKIAVNKAKEIEKEVIINANRDGVDMVIDKKKFISGEQYYNKTFNTKER